MNIILFESNELSNEADKTAGGVLQKRDIRAIHLVKILHKKIGDIFDAGIIDGGPAEGTIANILENGDIEYVLRNTGTPLPRLPITVAVGFVRPIQLRRLLRDLSAMGVEEIDLIQTELGDKSYRETNLLFDGGARDAVIEGCTQSRDTVLPIIKLYTSVENFLQNKREDGTLFKHTLVCADNIGASGTFRTLFDSGVAHTGFCLAIGSERGWSEHERQLFTAANFQRLALGSRALRTETAAIACTSAAERLLILTV
jgi:RsmE family RNA methyltransferase